MGDSQALVVDRGDGAVLGAIRLGAADRGTYERLLADARRLELDAFCAEWGLTTR